jgi:hypothetical protein
MALIYMMGKILIISRWAADLIKYCPPLLSPALNRASFTAIKAVMTNLKIEN